MDERTTPQELMDKSSLTVELYPAVQSMANSLLADEAAAIKTIIDAILNLQLPSQARVLAYVQDMLRQLAEQRKLAVTHLHSEVQALCDNAIEDFQKELEGKTNSAATAIPESGEVM